MSLDNYLDEKWRYDQIKNNNIIVIASSGILRRILESKPPGINVLSLNYKNSSRKKRNNWLQQLIY